MFWRESNSGFSRSLCSLQLQRSVQTQGRSWRVRIFFFLFFKTTEFQSQDLFMLESCDNSHLNVFKLFFSAFPIQSSEDNSYRSTTSSCCTNVSPRKNPSWCWTETLTPGIPSAFISYIVPDGRFSVASIITSQVRRLFSWMSGRRFRCPGGCKENTSR